MRILHVISRLDSDGTPLHVSLDLPSNRFQSRVCVLGPDTACTQQLRDIGATVDVLGKRRAVPVTSLWRLRQVVRAYAPDVIHAWDGAALRAATLARVGGGARLVASRPLPPDYCGAAPGVFDRWLLRRSGRILVHDPAERAACVACRLPEANLITVPRPGATAPSTAAPPLPEGLSGPARWIVCAGPLIASRAFDDAIWALDILQFLYDDVHMLLIGTGPERCRLGEFARGLEDESHLHFLGDRPDLGALLARADLVWVPQRWGHDVEPALSAMAAGRPVVATDLPAMAGIISDGQTGCLVPPGDKAALARTSRLLLEDPARAAAIGAAGRAHVERHFAPAAWLERLTRVYEDVAA